MEHLPEPSRTPTIHLHSLSAPRFFLLICALALILSALLLACGGEAVDQNVSGQGARPAETTAEARSEEGDPTATRAASTGAAASTPQSGTASRAASTGAAASTPQSGTASRAASTRAAASTPQSGGAPTSEATRGSAPSTQPAATAAPTPAPTPGGPQCPTGSTRTQSLRARRRRLPRKPTGRRWLPCSTPPTGSLGMIRESGWGLRQSVGGRASRPTATAELSVWDSTHHTLATTR